MRLLFGHEGIVAVRDVGDGNYNIIGEHGEKTVKSENPVEIGLAVKELMTGHFLAPPKAWKPAEIPATTTEMDGEGDTND